RSRGPRSPPSSARNRCACIRAPPPHHWTRRAGRSTEASGSATPGTAATGPWWGPPWRSGATPGSARAAASPTPSARPRAARSGPRRRGRRTTPSRPRGGPSSTSWSATDAAASTGSAAKSACAETRLAEREEGGADAAGVVAEPRFGDAQDAGLCPAGDLADLTLDQGAEAGDAVEHAAAEDELAGVEEGDGVSDGQAEVGGHLLEEVEGEGVARLGGQVQRVGADPGHVASRGLEDRRRLPFPHQLLQALGHVVPAGV